MKKYFLIGILSIAGLAGLHAQQKSPAQPARVVVINKADGTRETLMMSDVDRITFGYSEEVVESPAEAEPIDMGVSVKWASFNLGATEEAGRGFLVGWGDNTAVNESENLNFYPKKTPPATIIETEYDLAQLMWGGDWRLPTDAEFQELIDACEWAWDEDRQGFLATATNGNTLFFPATGYRLGHSLVEEETLNGYYWTGFLSKDSRQALAAKIFESGGEDTASLLAMDRYLGLAIRPVQGEYVLPLSVSASLPGTVGFTDASVRETFDGNTTGVTAYGVAYQKYKSGQEFDFETAAKVEKTGVPTDNQATFSLTGLEENTLYAVMAYAKVGDNIVKAAQTIMFTTDCRYVDLGLSVKWAKWNVGAESVNEYGSYVGWGDPTGELVSPYEGVYANGNTSDCISGDPKYDIATAKWGSHWRLPTREEFEEMISASGSVWSYKNEGGIQKYVATFPNGKTLEFPINGFMDYSCTTSAYTSHGFYWTGDAQNNGTEPYYLHISSPRALELTIGSKKTHLFVRPVYVDDPVDPEPGEDDPVEPATKEAGTAVDLGLWSGTLWANYNVGAKSETEAGVFVAWGETEEKISEGYHKENYAFWDANNPQYSGYSQSPGEEISGTEYDIAHVRWKGKWTMPTETQFKELRDDCTWTPETRKGVFGYKVTGPNGKSIFLPCQGYYNGDDYLKKNEEGMYWCSTIYMFARMYEMGVAMILTNEGYEWSHYSRKAGLNVRPVINGNR